MTEGEWLECGDPEAMLEFLRGTVSERKLRLFAVACCRRNQGFVESWYHRLAEVVELQADGQATVEDVKAAVEAVHDPDWVAGRAFEEAASEGDATDAAICAADDAAYAATCRLLPDNATSEGSAEWRRLHGAERAAQVALMRDIFGNPFRPMPCDGSILAPPVISIGSDIYNDRAFERMPVLADALVRAGCRNQEIVDHCRGTGPHVRGRLVLDLVLGKG